MKKLTIALVLLLALPMALAHGYDNAHFWETFEQGNDFTASLAVGDSSSDVAAALDLSLIILQNTGVRVSAIEHTDFEIGRAIIVTSGEVEEEFAPVFEACGIEAEKQKRLAQFCELDNGEVYYIVYGETGSDVRALAQDVAKGNIHGERMAIPSSSPRASANVGVNAGVNTSVDVQITAPHTTNTSEFVPNNGSAAIEQNATVEIPQTNATVNTAAQTEQRGIFTRIAAWFRNLFS